MKNIVHSFQGEWLKTRRSAADWLTIGGALLVPLIYLVNRLIDFEQTYQVNKMKNTWGQLFSHCWQITCLMILPLGAILVTSLIIQLEFRNNTWKQTLTTPQSLSRVFFTKFSVILVMLLQFFLIFNIAILLCGIVPTLVYKAVSFPAAPKALFPFLKANLKFFIDCLPVVAIQLFAALRFKNAMIPLGIGIGLYISSVIAVSWKYGYWIPYTYTLLNFRPANSPIPGSINTHLWALGYFTLALSLSYLLFINRKEKG